MNDVELLSDVDAIVALVQERSGHHYWDIFDADLPRDPYDGATYRAAVVGNTLVLGAFVTDESPAEDYWDMADGLGELCTMDGAGGRVYYRDQERIEQRIEQCREDGEVYVLVDCYEHGQRHYSVANTQPYPDRRWDVGVRGIYVPCADVQSEYRKAKHRRGGKAAAMVAVVKDANMMLDEYSKYINGEVYGVATCIVDLTTAESADGESCWGYIGAEYAEKVLESDVRAAAARAAAREESAA